MSNTADEKILIPKPITDWIIKILTNLYNDKNTSNNTGIDMQKMIFFDLLHLLQVCKNPDNKWNLKFKMKTKKALNNDSGLVELMICVYGPLVMSTDTGDVKLFVDIFIPRHETYKISRAPIVLIDFEQTLSNNLNNDTLKYWLKDEVKFQEDYVATDQWMALDFKKRNLVNLAEKVIQFSQTSLSKFEEEFSKKPKTLQKNLLNDKHKTDKVPEITKEIANINILDDVNLENELKQKMKENKEHLLLALQNKVDNIHNTAIPSINKHNEKKQKQLQEFIQYYEDALESYKLRFQFARSVEEQRVSHEDLDLIPLLKQSKPLSKLGLTEIVDIANINFDSQYENWYIERSSKLDAYKQLYGDLKEDFVKASLHDTKDKASADLIDFNTSSGSNKDYENLKSQLKIMENLAADEFDIRFDLLNYDKKI